MIINADDMCFSKGASLAIIDLCERGQVNSVSVMSNQDRYFEDLYWLKEQKTIAIGLHVNLTYGRSVTNSALISDAGKFNQTFLGLAMKSLLSRSFRDALRVEIVAQYEKMIADGINVTHIDSHRHVHLIPWIFPIVYDIFKQKCLKRIRLINENPLVTVKIFQNARIVSNGGIFKWIFLQTCSAFLRYRYKLTSEPNSCSVAFTGSCVKSIIKAPDAFRDSELIVHPSFPYEDEFSVFYNIAEKKYRLDEQRLKEYDALKSCVLK